MALNVAGIAVLGGCRQRTRGLSAYAVWCAASCSSGESERLWQQPRPRSALAAAAAAPVDLDWYGSTLAAQVGELAAEGVRGRRAVRAPCVDSFDKWSHWLRTGGAFNGLAPPPAMMACHRYSSCSMRHSWLFCRFRRCRLATLAALVREAPPISHMCL